MDRVQDILDMENRLFTLTDKYMTRVNEKKKEIHTDTKENSGQVALSTTTGRSTTVYPQFKTHTPATFILSTVNDSIYTPGFNEVQAAVDIQITLDSYSKIVQKFIIDTISQISYQQLLTRCALVVHKDMTNLCPSSDLVRYMKEPVDRTLQQDKLKRSIKAYETVLKLEQEQL